MNEIYTTKTVLITGASKGLGAATAKLFAKHHYNVIINYLSSSALAASLKEEIESLYHVNVTCYQCDISNEEEVKKIVTFLEENHITIDTLINNAAITNDSIVEDKTSKDFMNILNTNLIGPFLTSKYIGKYMLNNNGTSIVNISSTNAIDSYYPYSMDYDASKAGVISLTHNFAKLYAPNVRVNCIAPGWINTESNNLSDEQIEEESKNILLKRFASPEEISESIYFAATNTYLNDSILKIDGGHNND